VARSAVDASGGVLCFFFAALLVIWALSYRRAELVFHADVGEYAKDHYDKHYIFLQAWNGEMEFVYGTRRFIGPNWQDRVEKGDTRYLGEHNYINIFWSPQMVQLHPGSGLPLMQPRPAPKRDNWWARYLDWRVEQSPLPFGMGLSPVHMNVRFKLWFLFLPLSFFPVLWLLRKFRERRWRKAGRCVQCNYDLRGRPEKCPECGLAVKGKLGQASR
jgi:hypothetical protein